MKCLFRTFSIDGDTVGVTIGRDPETCSEAPRLQWRTRAGIDNEVVLSPLYNWNVSALWCSGQHLVFGLEAYYEGGDSAEALAFWDLGAGRFDVFPGNGSDLFLSDYFPDWQHAAVSSAGNWIALSSSQGAVAFWPEEKRWSILSPSTSLPIPDPVRTVELPKEFPATLGRAMRDAIPKAAGFTAVRAYSIGEHTVVVYRTNVERVTSAGQSYDTIRGYLVARWGAGQANPELLGTVVDIPFLSGPHAVSLRSYWRGELIFQFADDKGTRIVKYRLKSTPSR